MMVKRESVLVPTSGQLEDMVWENLPMIEGLSRASVRGIVVSDLVRQNPHSSRIGGEVRLRVGQGCDPEITLWAKRVENPEAAFCRMCAAYERAAKHGLAGPIPKPHFFDQQWGLVFMDKAHGALLRSMVLRHAISPRSAQGARLGSIMYRIGGWLCCYHDAVKVDAPFDPNQLIAQIESSLVRDESISRMDRERIAEHLRLVRYSLQHVDIELDQVWPHNDFTLRNLFLAENGEFIALDWDAMAHPSFSQTTNGLWDVTLFLLNLYSLDRFRPIARAPRLHKLGQEFLSGYLDAATANGRGVTRATITQ